ncbi:zinc finger protein OZF [Octopus bimaculoides]|uniref:C2H2-type domain-containing protein n=1 Tax=Octopus bimaculoides TaxID=37653 RepID=A0A0L8I5R5_OCTBM|nr:zinc finger protein OZF [Octopus bimaculoides]XP_014790728.1 zinc finger protein OZF [Octopus bimaculoides]|eukprot:XP_014790726.1 PREDICTED: zinc finger protein OZF-like [Octopus bimaculoides]
MYTIPSMYSVGKQYIFDITGKAFTQEDLVRSEDYFDNSSEKQFSYTSQPTFPTQPNMNSLEQPTSTSSTSENYVSYRKPFPQQTVSSQGAGETSRNSEATEGETENTNYSGDCCSDQQRARNCSTSCYSTPKAHKCAHCSKTFARRTYLKSHERVHSGEKPFNCMYCRKAFSQRTNVRSHERTHTGEKPYMCLICRRSFCQQNELRSHERVHTGVRPYQCHFCPKAFTQLTNLRNHIRIHTGEKPFVCIVCARSFTQHNELRSHERVHTGEKPFSCSMCSKAFSQRTNLRNHERVHSGEKPFQCIYCSKSFSQRGTLKNHEHTHTTDKNQVKTSQKSASLSSSNSLSHHSKTHEQKSRQLGQQELIQAASSAEQCQKEPSTSAFHHKPQSSSVISKWVNSTSLHSKSQSNSSISRISHANTHGRVSLGDDSRKEIQSSSSIRFQQVPTIPPVIMAPSFLHQMTQGWENTYNWPRGFPMAAAWNTSGKNISSVYSHEGKLKKQKSSSGDINKGKNMNSYDVRKEIQSSSK